MQDPSQIEIKPAKTNGKLTLRNKLFIEAYLSDPDKNQTNAYLKTYPNCSYETAMANSSYLLSQTKIKNEIDLRLSKLAKKTDITIDRVLSEYEKLAFFNPKSLFNADGTLKSIAEMDDNTAAALAGIDISTFTRKNEDGDSVFLTEVSKKIKFVDKKGVLDSIGRYLGMFIDKSITMTVNLEDFLLKMSKQQPEAEEVEAITDDNKQ